MVARSSRGASLLRTSRMFSMPKPLKLPDRGLEMGRRSNTATTPFPLHLSIVTSDAARNIGDWGLKRPLPKSKLNKTSTPVVKINEVDAIEAVTDYSPTACHTVALEKFHEMNIAVSAPSSKTYNSRETIVSVFEEEGDVTDVPAMKTAKFESTRWKFKGPWLAALSEPEFQRYLNKVVRPKKAEFRAFLRQRCVDRLNQETTQKALDTGREPPVPRPASSVTDKELIPFIRQLRAARPLLLQLVGDFLDLAPAQPTKPAYEFAFAGRHAESTAGMASTGAGPELDKTIQSGAKNNPYAHKGPPVTHPSAGISYLRTGAFLENHPLYGPQMQHTPVLSRVLTPKRLNKDPKLGLGGFVVSVPPSLAPTKNFRARWQTIDDDNNQSAFLRFDPNIKGGASAYLTPTTAKAHHDGRIEVVVTKSSPMAQLIKKERDGIGAIYLDDRNAANATDAHESHEERLQKDMEYAKAELKNVLSSASSYGLMK